MPPPVRSLAAAWRWLALATALAIPVWLLVRDERTAFLAGNIQSWRKYIEHIGLTGTTWATLTRGTFTCPTR